MSSHLLIISVFLLSGNILATEAKDREPMQVIASLSDLYMLLNKRLDDSGIKCNENLVDKPLDDKFIDCLVENTVGNQDKYIVEFYKKSHRGLTSRDIPSGKEHFSEFIYERYNNDCEKLINTIESQPDYQKIYLDTTYRMFSKPYYLCKATRKYIQQDDLINKTYSAFRKKYSKLNKLFKN